MKVLPMNIDITTLDPALASDIAGDDNFCTRIQNAVAQGTDAHTRINDRVDRTEPSAGKH
mgnify:CR=1 FL=1